MCFVSPHHAVHREPQPFLERKPHGLEPQQPLLSHRHSRRLVWTTGHDSRNISPPYNGHQRHSRHGLLHAGRPQYYYYMASQFATSDRWFSPVMTRTSSNREIPDRGTSQGDVYPIGSDSGDRSLLTATTIFQNWKLPASAGRFTSTPTIPRARQPNSAMHADAQLRAEFSVGPLNSHDLSSEHRHHDAVCPMEMTSGRSHEPCSVRRRTVRAWSDFDQVISRRQYCVMVAMF